MKQSTILRYALLSLLALPLSAWGQSSSSQAQSTGQQQSTQPQTQQQKPQQAAPAEAGGPGGDVGPIALPKKKEEEAPTPPRPRPVPQQTPTFSMSVDVPLVTLDVSVLTKDGHQFVPGLKRDNFKVFEDGVEQKVSQFGQTGEAPITAVLLVEFANNRNLWDVMIQSLRASYTFAQSLKKDDWIAVVAYDLKSQILTDFTQDKRQVYAALGQLRPQTAGFSETDLFDALYDTIDRLEGIQGRKYILLVSTGRDTFSKMNLDKTLTKIKSAKDITIYSIGLGTALRKMGYSRYLCPEATLQCSEIEFLQADNQLDTFARLTGGRSYHPNFDGELPDIFNDIAADIRNEYILAYHPTNPRLDGTFRKLKVQIVAPDGGPLKVKNEKGKELKIEVVAREGYTARHQVD
ncbi:MAG: VWA domain-containing protein [Acidobacteria bacterium]|nr:VWA domain-containing protein [Acidobacteriota bacterium]